MFSIGDKLPVEIREVLKQLTQLYLLSSPGIPNCYYYLGRNNNYSPGQISSQRSNNLYTYTELHGIHAEATLYINSTADAASPEIVLNRLREPQGSPLLESPRTTVERLQSTLGHELADKMINLIRPTANLKIKVIAEDKDNTEIPEEKFNELGYIKLTIRDYNKLVANVKRNISVDSALLFSKIYYKESTDTYIYYTNLVDVDEFRLYTGAFCAIVTEHSAVCRERLTPLEMQWYKDLLDAFKFMRVRRSVGSLSSNPMITLLGKQPYFMNIIKDHKISNYFANLGNSLKRNIQSSISDLDSRLSRIQSDLNSTFRTKRELELQLLDADNYTEEEVNKLKEFLNKPNIFDYNFDGNLIKYSIKTPMIQVRTEDIEVLRPINSAIKLCKKLYLDEEEPGYIYGISLYELDLHNKNIKAVNLYNIGVGGIASQYPSINPHHMLWGCLGTYEVMLRSAVMSKDYDVIYNISTAATQNLNVSDSAVMERFSTYMNSVPSAIMVHYKGHDMTYKEMMDILNYPTPAPVVEETEVEVEEEEEEEVVMPPQGIVRTYTANNGVLRSYRLMPNGSVISELTGTAYLNYDTFVATVEATADIHLIRTEQEYIDTILHGTHVYSTYNNGNILCNETNIVYANAVDYANATDLRVTELQEPPIILPNEATEEDIEAVEEELQNDEDLAEDENDDDEENDAPLNAIRNFFHQAERVIDPDLARTFDPVRIDPMMIPPLNDPVTIDDVRQIGRDLQRHYNYTPPGDYDVHTEWTVDNRTTPVTAADPHIYPARNITDELPADDLEPTNAMEEQTVTEEEAEDYEW